MIFEFEAQTEELTKPFSEAEIKHIEVEKFYSPRP